MTVSFTIVDAFTDQPFAGNPAAVVPLTAPADPLWMQKVAAEFNLSETAFIHPEGDLWRIRWFTPTVEVRLCGHATLASAAVLWHRNLVPKGQSITFTSQSGLLQARRESTAILLDFPGKPCEIAPAPEGLAAAIGAEILCAGNNHLDWLVEVVDAKTVANLAPDLAVVKQLPLRGVIVTAPGEPGSGFDVVSRFFAPSAGVAEDPVTGSAHCALTPWWAKRLGKTELLCHQLSRRGGTIRCRLRDDRVDLIGQAVIVAQGEIHV